MSTIRSDLHADARHVLPALPYDRGALQSVISGRTVGLHYDKHHKGYVDKVNQLVVGTPYAEATLEEIVTATVGKRELADLYSCAAQAWNHAFYWQSLRPSGGGQPPFALRQRIDAAFGSFDACKRALASAAVAQFGSGWAWLVLDGETLAVATTSNADVPFTQGRKPLLTIDVWEHAYYVDYENRRAEYVNAVIDKLVNWEFALQNAG